MRIWRICVHVYIHRRARYDRDAWKWENHSVQGPLTPRVRTFTGGVPSLDPHQASNLLGDNIYGTPRMITSGSRVCFTPSTFSPPGTFEGESTDVTRLSRVGRCASGLFWHASQLDPQSPAGFLNTTRPGTRLHPFFPPSRRPEPD